MERRPTDLSVLQGALNNHYRIVQRTFGLGNILFRTSTEQQCRCLRIRTSCKEVVALAANLNLLESVAATENRLRQVAAHNHLARAQSIDNVKKPSESKCLRLISSEELKQKLKLNRKLESANLPKRGLHLGAGGLADAREVVVRNAAGAEDITVGKVLRGQVADWQLAQHDLGARVRNAVELLVDDLPLGVDLLLSKQEATGRTSQRHTIDWYCSGLEMRISAFSFSDFNSSSTLRAMILTLSKDLGCCSNPAYENVFLNATPWTRKES